MAILTLQELIAQRESIKDKRNQKYEIETSLGTILATVPDAALVSEAMSLKDDGALRNHIVYNSVVEPNLKDAELQKVYGVMEPTEIVTAIFSPGEIFKIADKLLDLAGYDKKINAKLHETVKK